MGICLVHCQFRYCALAGYGFLPLDLTLGFSPNKQTSWGVGQGEGRKEVLPLREKTAASDVSINTQADGDTEPCVTVSLYFSQKAPWRSISRLIALSLFNEEGGCPGLVGRRVSPQNGVTAAKGERSWQRPACVSLGGSAPAQPALPVPVHTLWEVTWGVCPGTAPSRATPHRFSWPLLKSCARTRWRDNEKETHRTPVCAASGLSLGLARVGIRAVDTSSPSSSQSLRLRCPPSPPPPSLTLTALSPLCSLPIFLLRCGLGFSFQVIFCMEECFQWAEALIAK